MLEKICMIFVALFMATCCCMGEEMPEWTEQTDYADCHRRLSDDAGGDVL